MAIRILYLTGQDDLPIHNVTRLQSLSINTLKSSSDFLAEFLKATFFLRPNLGHPIHGNDKDDDSRVILGTGNQAEIFCDDEQEVKGK